MFERGSYVTGDFINGYVLERVRSCGVPCVSLITLDGKVEAPQLGGELDGAITDAITLAHRGASSSPAAPPPGIRDYAGRATRALHAAGKRAG